MWIVIPNYINTCYICTIKSVIQITGHWKLHILEKRMLRFRCSLDRDHSVYVLGGTHFNFFFFFFLCTRFNWGTEVTVHTVRLLFTHFSATFSLFTHLKIILLQYFQFSAKITCIQTNP